MDRLILSDAQWAKMEPLCLGKPGDPGRDWVKADVFKRLFDAVSDDPDMEYAMVDATIVKVHRHGQGAKGGLRARPSAVPKAA